MPFRMLFANPIALAVITVAAIGVITYQILKNNRKRVPTRGRIRYRGDDSDSDGPDKPDETPRSFSLNTRDDKRSLKVCDEPKSGTPSGVSEVRKRTVATQNPDDISETKHFKINCNESENHRDSFSNSIGGNSEFSSDSSRNHESLYSSQQNNETRKIQNNIRPLNSNKNFVANINEEDSDSSESNNLQVNSENIFVANIDDEDSDSDSDSDSSESNGSFQNRNKGMDLDETIHSIASCSTTRSKNIKTPSPIDSSEELYKRDVCSYLKTGIDEENWKEKCFKDFSDEESHDVSENNFSVTSEDSNTFYSSRKKPDLCKGCLEEFPNAVAYPCKHCYLCLDCAVKVHRIFKKCTICFSVIKTFEQL